MPTDIHAKCLTTRTGDGRTLVCHKSRGHTSSTKPDRREHYDPSADERWTT